MKDGTERIDVQIEIEDNSRRGEGFSAAVYQQTDCGRPCHVMSEYPFKDKQAAILYLKKFIEQLQKEVENIDESHK